MPGFRKFLSQNVKKIPLCQGSEYFFPEIEKMFR